MKYLLPITLLCMLSLTSFAQANQDLEDVVYLKNGSVLRGRLQPTPGQNQDKVKIELAGGSVFVFNTTEVDSVKHENALKRKLKELNRNYYRHDRGYRNITELGFIYGTNTKTNTSDPYYNYSASGKDDFGVSVHTINGYQVWPYLFVGAGVGIDRFITYGQTFSPFYGRVSSEFLKKKATPYVFCDAGYSLMWKKKDDEYTHYHNQGGLYVSVGGGVRIYTRTRASVMIGLAYKRNNNQTDWTYKYESDVSYSIKRTYQRLVMNVGVSF